MKKVVIYFITIALLTFIFFLAARTYGIKTIENVCMPGRVDCSNSYMYSPLYWYPVKFVSYANGSYIIPAMYNNSVYRSVLPIALVYWFGIINAVVLPFIFLIPNVSRDH